MMYLLFFILMCNFSILAILYFRYTKVKKLEKSYRKVINYYGINNQQFKLIEEMKELKDEIEYSIITKGKNKTNIISEISDVLNMISQVMIIYDFDIKEVEEIMTRKMKRQIKRIEEEKQCKKLLFH